MAFLGPLFLLGLIGIGIPLWLHRLETQVTEREPFATTRFMEPAKNRIHVQRKLKYLLLMALRILFFILLAFAFARPVLFTNPQATVTQGSAHHVIVVDNSFSMRAGESFNNALTEARSIISNMEDDDVASIYSASSSLEQIQDTSRDVELLNLSLDSLSPDNGKLDLGQMIIGLNNYIEASQATFIYHIISDFQQSGQAARFADMIPDVINGRPVELDLVRLQSNNQLNHAVDSVIVENRNRVIVGISSYGGSEESIPRTVSLSVNNAVQQTEEVSLSGTGINYVRFEDVLFDEGDNRIDVSLEPQDLLAEDDIRYTVFDNSPPAPVLLLTSDPQSLGVTYITAALETAPRGYQVQAEIISELDTRILDRFPWMIIEDISAINASLAETLTNYVESGGAVLAGISETAMGLAAIPVLGNDISSLPLTRQESPSPVTMIDSSHPSLSDTSGWASVNFRTIPVATDNEDRILIGLASGQAVLMERNIGLGRIMLLTTTLDNSLSDLPVKPVFVSFMAEAAQYLSNENLLIREQVTDSFLQLTRAGGASGQVFDPEGSSLLSLSDTTQAQDIQLKLTGYYQVFTPSGEVLVAVNPDKRESDLTIMDVQVLQNWQNIVAGTANSEETGQNASENVQGEALEEQEIWRIFLILLVIIVLAESILGNRHLHVKTGNL